MFRLQTNSQRSKKRGGHIRLGFVRLLDAAPLIISDSLNLFRDAGLDVELCREPGWETIRDKLAFGALDASQALGPMPFIMQQGVNVAQTKVIAGMVLNCNGNAITLSSELRKHEVHDGPSLRRYVRAANRPRKLVLGVVSKASSHNFILCRWLQENKITPHEDVIISVLPPEQMVRNLAANNIDGFCVGEPWNSIAVEEGIGWCPATSQEVADGYPEKVLATTERFYSYRGAEYKKMLEVLVYACELCDEPDRRESVLEILSKSKYLNCRPETLSHAFAESFPKGFGEQATGRFVRFSGAQVNRPSLKMARTIYSDLQKFLPNKALADLDDKALSEIFRTSIYDQVSANVVF